MCNLFLFVEMGRVCCGLAGGCCLSSLNEPDSATRYFAQTFTRFDDETTYSRSHSLQVWMFAEEQCDSALSNEVWNVVISSRGTDVGSGRKSPAENEAFAMAS